MRLGSLELDVVRGGDFLDLPEGVDDLQARAARQAGKKPPKRPMASEKTMPPAIKGGVRRKLKRISENVRKFIVPVGAVTRMLKRTNASAVPAIRLTAHRNRASRTKETRIATLEKPYRPGSVPISRVRAATCAYIVFMAPKEAPIAVKMPTRMASTLMGAPVTICSS